MNIIELMAEIEKYGRRLGASLDGKLIVFSRVDPSLSPLPESLRVCLKRHKPALIEMSIQKGAVYQHNGERRVLVSQEELDRFVHSESEG